MWKPASYTMARIVSRITSWVLVCSLPWVQCKRWIPIGSMGCVHIHWKRPVIEGCGNPNRVWSIVKKTKKDNQKAGFKKSIQVIRQTSNPTSKLDKIWRQWVSSILSKSMLENIWWCKCYEMESKSQTICCLMNYSKRGRCVHTTLKC